MSGTLDSNLTSAQELFEASRVEEALALYSQLFANHSGDQRVCVGFAKALCAVGDAKQALIVLDAYAKDNPNYSTSAELYFAKGLAHELQKQWQEAIKCYETSIYFDPTGFEALYNQGNIFLELGKYNDALMRYESAAKLNPSHAQLLNNAGIASVNSTRFDLGIDYFDAAIKAQPDFFEAQKNKAWTLLSAGQAHSAMEEFARLIAVGHEQSNVSLVIDAYKGTGLAQVELGENKQALESFNAAIELQSNDPELFNNRGNVYKYLNEWDMAIADFERSLALKSRYHLAHSNLGNVYKERGQFDQALKHYQLAIDCEPAFAQAHLNKALLLLGAGRFDLGLQEYEWRWATPEYAHQVLKTSKPLWDVRERVEQLLAITPTPVPTHVPAPAQTVQAHAKTPRLLVWNEKGVGDDIYFARFLPLVRSLVEKLIVRVEPRLVQLFRRSFANIDFIAEGEFVNEDAYDAHIPMGSLAQLGSVFASGKCPSPDLSHAPLAQPYLSCEEGESKGLRGVLNLKNQILLAGELVVGLSWRSLHPQSGAKRSLALRDLITGLQRSQSPASGLNSSAQSAKKLKTIKWINLQYSDVSQELEDTAAELGVRIETVKDLDVEHDLASTAHLIRSCDLVISIDNTTAHMAAALGVKTWVLVPFTSDWRWQVVSDRVYGYARAQTYRQTVINDWDQPLAQMAIDLFKLLESGDGLKK